MHQVLFCHIKVFTLHNSSLVLYQLSLVHLTGSYLSLSLYPLLIPPFHIMPSPACPSPTRHHSPSPSYSSRHDSHQPYTRDNSSMRDARSFRTPPPTLLMDQMQISQPQPYSQSPTSYLTTHELQQQQPRQQRTRPRRQSLVASESQLGGPLPLNSSRRNVNTSRIHQYSQPHPNRHYLYSGPPSAPPTAPSYSTSNTYQEPYAPPHPTQLRNIAPAPSSVPPSAFIRSQQQQQYLRQFQQQHQQRSQAQALAPPSSNNISPSLHPQFRAKAVCRLTCRSCLSDVCMRGMKAILLADSRIELYSTDRPPAG